MVVGLLADPLQLLVLALCEEEEERAHGGGGKWTGGTMENQDGGGGEFWVWIRNLDAFRKIKGRVD